MSAGTNHDTFLGTRVFSSLDGLRCLSIVGVVWFHGGVLPFGHYGVDLFFALSGFLITTLLLRERTTRGDISLGAFYMRRTLRIFPLYYAVLAVYVVLVLVFERGTPEGAAFWGNLPAYLTYTSNWFVDLGDGRVIFYFAWSLATEEQFYLFWPWIEKYVRARLAVPLMAVLLCIGWTAHAGALDGFLGADSLLRTALASIAPSLGLGVLLAHLLYDRRGFEYAFRLLGSRFAAPLGLVALLAA